MLVQPDMHGDLKATLEKSLEIKAVLASMVGDTGQQGNHRTMNRLDQMQKRIKTTKDSLGFPDTCVYKAKKAMTPSTLRPTNTASPTNRRRDGKKKLYKSLRDGNLRILATKAGRYIEVIDDPSETHVLRVIKDMQLDSAKITERSYDLNTSRLPFVSLISGRLEDPINLPTFEQYSISTLKNGMSSPVEKAIRSVKRTMEHITNFRTKMDGILANSKLPSSRHSSNRRSGLRSMTMPSEQLSLFIESLEQGPAAEEKSLITAIPEAKRKDTARTSTTISVSNDQNFKRRFVSSPKPSTPRERCSIPGDNRQLCGTIDTQENKLSQIVESIAEERPITVRRKQRLLSSDLEQLLGIGTAVKLLTDIRLSAEQQRLAKRRLNKRQAEMYRRLLERLFNRRVMPNSVEIGVIEAVRRVIESGEIIDRDSLSHVKHALRANAGQAEELIKLIETLAQRTCGEEPEAFL